MCVARVGTDILRRSSSYFGGGWCMKRVETYQRLWVCACSVYPLDQVGDEQHACRQGTRDAEALRQAGTQAGIRLARRLLQDKVTALRETPFWWRLRIGLWWSTACGTCSAQLKRSCLTRGKLMIRAWRDKGHKHRSSGWTNSRREKPRPKPTVQERRGEPY